MRSQNRDWVQERGVAHTECHDESPWHIVWNMYHCIIIAIVPRNYMVASSWCGLQRRLGQMAIPCENSNRMQLSLCCNHCCCCREYNFPTTPPITDIQPDVTTLTAIYTISDIDHTTASTLSDLILLLLWMHGNLHTTAVKINRLINYYFNNQLIFLSHFQVLWFQC